MIFNGTVFGELEISGCNSGNSDRDCKEHTRFYSAKSTESEIGAKLEQIYIHPFRSSEVIGGGDERVQRPSATLCVNEPV